jgi:hypothetical protein
MKSKGFLVLIFVLAVVFGVYSFFRQDQDESLTMMAESLPLTQEEEAALETELGLELAPGVETTRLADVEGGAKTGMATRETKEGKFEHYLMASLPEPEGSRFYQGWLVKDGEFLLTGKLEERKGGWVLGYADVSDRGEYSQVVVTLEEKDDGEPEKKVLEGNF